MDQIVIKGKKHKQDTDQYRLGNGRSFLIIRCGNSLLLGDQRAKIIYLKVDLVRLMKVIP